MAGPTLSPCSETLSENGINQEETETREGERERNRIPWSSREVMPGVSSTSGFLSCMNQSIPPVLEPACWVCCHLEPGEF